MIENTKAGLEAGPGAGAAGGPHPADRRHLQNIGGQQGYLLPLHDPQHIPATLTANEGIASG